MRKPHIFPDCTCKMYSIRSRFVRTVRDYVPSVFLFRAPYILYLKTQFNDCMGPGESQCLEQPVIVSKPQSLQFNPHVYIFYFSPINCKVLRPHIGIYRSVSWLLSFPLKSFTQNPSSKCVLYIHPMPS